MSATNVILGKNGTNQLTIYSSVVEEIQSKVLTVIVPGVSSKNWAGGSKDSMVVDLLRVTQRFNVDGFLLSEDRTKFRNLMGQGGIFRFDYNGEYFNVNFEKFSIKQKSEDDTENAQPGNYDIKFSVVVGENVGAKD